MNKNKTLLQKFTEFNAAKRLASRKKRTLLAVSGGVDSVVMCELFYRAGFPFSILHCNFQLRGKESEADEAFVNSLGKRYSTDVFCKRFETGEYAKEKKLSVQLAARELRYQWFEEMRKEKNFQLVATAHHLNDNIETILYNMIKGTGVRGLRGIPVRQENVVRPLLFASREEIEGYCREEALKFREDSSNEDDKYTRNKIRHHLIPLMKEINPSLEKTWLDKIELFVQLETMYERSVKKSSAQVFLQRKKDVYIPIAKLKKMKDAASVLFEYLSPLGFNASQVEDMLSNLDDVPGKQFLTQQARVIKDRKFFILTKLPEKEFTIKLIEKGDKEISLGTRRLVMEYLKTSGQKSDIRFTPDADVAYVNKSKLTFPLVVRHWKAGDYFYPFGMKMKKKKLKKLFADEKVPLHEKEQVWVIESDGRIVWVAGYRMDERFRITEHTEEVLKIRLQ